MNKVPPSRMIRQEIDDLVTSGAEDDQNVLSTLAELGLRYVAQRALEQDQADS